MAEVQQAASMPAPVKTSHQNRMNLEAVAGPSLEVAAASGKISLTDTPKIGEPEAFFPANPAIANELAQNKPVKALTSAERTSSGGLMRTISDVITELVQKHQNKKRVCAIQSMLGQRVPNAFAAPEVSNNAAASMLPAHS
jgi:hypothetical protein